MGRPNVNVNYLLTVEWGWLNRSVRINFFHLIRGIWFLSSCFIQPELVEPDHNKTTQSRHLYKWNRENLPVLYSLKPLQHTMHSMFITKPLNILYSRFLVCCMQVSEQCCCCVYCCVYTAGPKLLYRQRRDWQWQKTVCHFWRMLPHKLFIMKESLCSISFNLTPRRAHEFVRTPMGGAVLFWKVEDRFHKLHKNLSFMGNIQWLCH